MSKTPSERIKLIQDISDKLSYEDWPIIDLTLRQFGLQTTDQWSGSDKKGYVISMIDKSDDESLAQLHFHLTGENNIVKQSDTIAFWQPGTYRIFLSHLSEFKIVASQIKEKLESLHCSVFIAHEDIQPTKEWQSEIELALDSTDCVIALVTKGFHQSDWTDQEIGIAMGKGKLVIPIAAGGKPYGFLSKYQWLKNENLDIQEIYDQTFTILTQHNLSKRKFSEALVNKLESSYSFANAKSNIILLEKVEYLDSDLLKRIQEAHDNNYQINQSFGVTSRVQSLIAKKRQNS